MVKRKRPEDLTNVGPLPDQEVTRNVTRINLMDLPDEGRQETPQSVLTEAETPVSIAQVVGEVPFVRKRESPPSVVPVLPKPSREVLESVTFDRSIAHLYFYKMFSFLFIMSTFELLMHFLKHLDGLNVFDPANFTSYFFGTYTEWNILKVMVLVLVVYVMTPHEKVMMNKKGILCHRVDLMYFFFTAQRVFIQWDEIAKVEHHLRFFEPYLFFYDKEGKVLGQLDFSLSRPEDFFYFIEKNVGKNHPIFSTKKGPF